MPDICTCGCGKKRSIVIREIMDKGMNEEQADQMFWQGNEYRRRNPE